MARTFFQGRSTTLLPLAGLLLGASACGGDVARERELGPGYDDAIWTEAADGKADTSAIGVVKRIDWDGFVLVPVGASNEVVQAEVRRQIKSALGALRTGPQISLRDRDARSNLDTGRMVRETLTVVGADGQDAGTIDRVRYHYTDLALVLKTYRPSTLAVTLLFSDYVARYGELSVDCADEIDSDAGSLWYHYAPGQSRCARRISDEQKKIDAATQALGARAGVLAQVELDRRFETVRAQLGPAQTPAATYPEYDRLWGFGTDRTKVVVYSFFGVDSDDRNPRDNGLVESMRYLRTVRAQFPKLAVVETRPFAFLLDFYLDGQKLDGITYEQVAGWVLDGSGWPTAAATDTAKQKQLLEQVRDRWLERWIVWQLPVTVKRGGETRSMTIEIRTYYGREDGREDWRLHARWRYLEAFWHGDVFAYTGHSHFGHGPLEPVEYSGANFPDRYQTFLFNSCLSYNYYDVDFLEMHPGGTRNAEVVVNGLAAYWNSMGEASAKYVIGLLDGQNKSWGQILTGMTVNLSFARNYDPMRAVNGELDNAFNPAQGKIELTY